MYCIERETTIDNVYPFKDGFNQGSKVFLEDVIDTYYFLSNKRLEAK